MRNHIHPLFGILLLSLPLIFGSGNLFAQEPDSLRLTLSEAQQIALKNNPAFLVSGLEAELARNTAAQSRQQRYPLLYGDVNMQRNLILPTTPVPAKAFDPSAGEDELIHLRFTTRWTANTGLNASFDLFNPERAGSIERAAMEARLAESDRQGSENELIFNVGNAFYACFIAEEQLRLAESDTLVRRTILEMLERQFEQGRANQAELNLARTELNNSRILYEESKMIYNNSKGDLLLLLGLPPDKQVSLQLERDEDPREWEEVFSADTAGRQSIGLARLQQELAINLLDRKIARRSYLPVISLNGYYGANYFDNRFELFKGSNWYGNSFVNIGIRLPLSENLLRSKELARLKIQEDVISQEVRAAEYERQKNIQEAGRELGYRQFEYSRRKENFDMAEENAEIADLQYRNGRLLIGDYYQQLHQFQKERAAYLESKYRLLVSRLSLEKAKSE